LDNLPVAAPQLAPYGTALLLVFVQQTNTAPGTDAYRIDAPASRSAVQSINSVDLALAHQSNVNFSLTLQERKPATSPLPATGRTTACGSPWAKFPHFSGAVHLASDPDD
jgi:hypothetical protein